MVDFSKKFHGVGQRIVVRLWPQSQLLLDKRYPIGPVHCPGLSQPKQHRGALNVVVGILGVARIVGRSTIDELMPWNYGPKTKATVAYCINKINCDRANTKLLGELTMLKQLPLGKQGFITSEQGIGMMSIGITVGKKDLYGKKNDITVNGVSTLIRRCTDAGVTHFDTAQAYKNLWSIFIGSWFFLASSSEQKMKPGLANTKGKWQIATKVPPPGGKAHVKEACYQSCKDLGVECIDLYYLHRIDSKVPIEITMEAMNELIAEGKIKYVGISEASVSTIRRAHAVCPLTCVQMEWSLYARDLEDEIVPICAELGIGIVAYAPMGRGMLADTSLNLSKMGFMDFRKMGKVGYASKDGERRLVKALEKFAKVKGVTTAILSLAWLHKKGRDALKGAGIVPIPGTGNPAHMEENVKAVSLSYSLTDKDIQVIEDCIPREAMKDVARYGGSFAKDVFSVEKNILLTDWENNKK